MFPFAGAPITFIVSLLLCIIISWPHPIIAALFPRWLMPSNLSPYNPPKVDFEKCQNGENSKVIKKEGLDVVSLSWIKKVNGEESQPQKG